MYLVRKTSDGKSLVPQTIAFFRGGISVTLVPLIGIGLGCHQADKSSVAEHNLEAYHVDEYHGEDAKRLCKRLNGMSTEEAKEITIMLYISPQKMKANSNWFHVLKDIASKGLISIICIDEAHYVQQAGRSFRMEFVEAVESIAELLRKMPNPVPCIAMSATFTECDRNRVTELLGGMTPVISAGNLDRRSTTFTCHISGRPSSSLKSSAADHLQSSKYFTPTPAVLLREHYWKLHKLCCGSQSSRGSNHTMAASLSAFPASEIEDTSRRRRDFKRRHIWYRN